MREIMKSVSHLQASQLLHNKFIVVLGDSIQRSVYKDLVLLLQKEEYLSLKQLKTKGEKSFEQDCLMEGGCLDQMHNGTQYREVRQFQSAHHLVRFYFVTRIYSHYMQTVLEDFRHGLKPDVVIVNSCLWDISRYNCNWNDSYKENLHSFFDELHGVLPEETLVVWNLTMPLGEKIRGGFLVPEIEHKAQQLRYDVIEANFYSGTLADAYGMDVLDLHFQFRFSLQHRMKDGIHWNAVAHRKITSLVLQHAAEAWGVILPCPVTVYDRHHYNGYQAEFFSDTLPTNYLSFDNPWPQTCHFKAAGTWRSAPPPKRYHRNLDREAGNGFGYRPPHQFEPYKEDNHQHVMRSRHTRRHYTPYTQHRPLHSGRNYHYY
ncbi:PC-esterase domain-containing protein 1A-like isoform X2 [Archocentrus centrarchus]|uniref:PC-esterase domain-containing protein 1A-like isoform X2 n=1 Tax=Archocentrus centrarchus TaxID=63155 RepID=UPI0011E9D5B6|nr:PC-esterase domain-containing protein 1A-like isoform X2 [Archocentrus centrarchus]XP_030578605.1 PC-esterase domain-containing protein 1A-like isoform X2 [Archocentrus centrarchus]